MLYFAYGSNLHHFQMKRRCKDSIFIKKINLKGYSKSIYFFDPNGHRLELCANTGTAEQAKKLKSMAAGMLEDWAKTKTPPKDAAWLHSDEFNND